VRRILFCATLVGVNLGAVLSIESDSITVFNLLEKRKIKSNVKRINLYTRFLLVILAACLLTACRGGDKTPTVPLPPPSWANASILNSGVLTRLLLPIGREKQLVEDTDPDLLLPDLRTLPPYDLRLVVDQQGNRRSIRFSNAIYNRGAGPLEVQGILNRGDEIVSVSQVIYRSDGSTEQRKAGEFVFHAVHDHWHWEGFSLYEIWSTRADGSLNAMVASSGKVGYCLRDIDPLDSAHILADEIDEQAIPSRIGYGPCGWARQGLSVGWVDVYRANTPGQFVNIGGLPDGVYVLKSTVDPDNILLESDPTNNSALVYFTLRGTQLTVLEQPILQPPTIYGYI
jgi:hypothetical protein